MVMKDAGRYEIVENCEKYTAPSVSKCQQNLHCMKTDYLNELE